MDRTETEIKLLALRQKYKDALSFYSANRVIDLHKCLFLKVKIETCNELLILYRNYNLKTGVKCEKAS